MLACHMVAAKTVRLITIGPGDAFWSAFGHSAIAIDDVVYGFGYFSFEDDVIEEFIGNRMQYAIGVSDFNQELRLAEHYNRDFKVIELQLSATEVAEIEAYLEWHYLPENQTYHYDYFLNNCATKIRDVLNQQWGGTLNQVSQEPTGSSYFSATFPARHQGLMNLGLAVGFGWSAYTERNAWELMAFPVFMEQHLMAVMDDRLEPQQVIYTATEFDQFYSLMRSHWVLIFYVVVWSLLLSLKSTQKLTAKSWFIWHSTVGLVLLFLWLMTPHEVADWNFNVLLFNPLALLLLFKPKFKIWVAIGWLLWLLLAVWVQAWYLAPLLLPGGLALKALRAE